MKIFGIDPMTFAIYVGTSFAMVVVACRTFKTELSKFVGQQTKHKPSLQKHAEISTAIQARLYKFISLMGASTARVHLVHNGTRYLSGLSSLKVTCEEHAYREGYKADLDIYKQDMPICFSAPFIDKLIKKTIINCGDVDTCDGICDDKEYCDKSLKHFRDIEKDLKHQAFNAILLLDEHRDPIGFIVIGYEDKKDFTVNDIELSRLAEFVEEKVAELIKEDDKK